jgi:hypothetical protein
MTNLTTLTILTIPSHSPSPILKLYFVGDMYGNLPMNEFLIDCPFKQYSMVLKFGHLIQHYAILILRYAA